MEPKRYLVYEKNDNENNRRNYIRCDYNRKFHDRCDDECFEDRWEEKRRCHDKCDEWRDEDKQCEKDDRMKFWPDDRDYSDMPRKERPEKKRCDEKKDKYDDRYEEDMRYDGRSEEDWWNKEDKCKKEEEQTHVHEFEGSTKLAEECCERHNHRFAGVSGEEIKIPGSHVHRVYTRTDFFDHFHFICRLTGPAIYVDCDDDWDDKKGWKKKERKHVHFVKGMTTCNDGHMHEFQFATLIESPLLPQPKWPCGHM